MSKRTDCHRVGAIIPEHYKHVLSYNLATSDGGWPVPSFGINCQLDRRRWEKDDSGRLVVVEEGKHDEDGMCCLIGLRTIAKLPFTEHGGPGKCSVCGAAFVYGDIWRHEDGECIHVGHTCADKYQMLAERGGFDARYESFKQATAARRIAEENRQEREAFLDAHPGLREALVIDHTLVKDIAEKFRRFRSLSDKQVALVLRIADEAKSPKPAETHVPAPEGRVTVRGTIVSVKSQEGFRGEGCWKMTVKVATPTGTWLAWGTCPTSLVEHGLTPGVYDGRTLPERLRGAEVEFTATLAKGREPHFALFSRPSKARVVAPMLPAAAVA